MFQNAKNAPRWLIPGASLALVAVIVAVVVLTSRGDDRHLVVIQTKNAEGVIPGLAVRAAGRHVGEIESATVTPDYRATIKLRLDDSVWPLPASSRMQLRLAGTIKFTDRYIDLERGRRGPMIDDGGEFPSNRFATPVEFDQLFATFDKTTRANLGLFLTETAQATDGARKPLRDALRKAPPAVEEARNLLEDLGSDPTSLRVLVHSSDSVVHAAAASNPGIGQLVEHAAGTFATVASEASATRQTIERLPATLTTTRSTLRKADGTLQNATRLARRLSGGVRELNASAAPVNSLLRTLTTVAPDAESTVRTLRVAAPKLRQLLAQAKPTLPLIESIGKQADKQLHCIRPFAPDALAGIFGTWSTGAWGKTDGKDHLLRITFAVPPSISTSGPLNSKQLADTFPGVGISLPRPPGEIAGQPWFIPECGYTREFMDPATDPETGVTEQYPEEFKKRIPAGLGDGDGGGYPHITVKSDPK